MTRFIDLLWPDEPPGWLVVWTLPNKHSYWTRSKSEAHDYALRADGEVYIEVACGPDPRSLGRPPESARIKSDETVALPGFFADLDCSTHPTKVHFDSKDHGASFAGSMPREPTVVVDSGGGLHGWWLFKEPWVFESDEERRAAERLEYGWTNYLRNRAMEVGVRDGVDHVKDLARVLRYPGTKNHKYREPKPVSIRHSSGPRYNPSEFEPWESEVVGTRLTAADLKALELKLTAEAEPPFGKLKSLMDIDPRLRATWKRQRPDLKDRSKSGYDMSLAQQLALCGWSAEEIAATLVAWRREHGLPLKMREDYYARTIGNAMAFRDQLEAERAVESGELAPGVEHEQFARTVAGVTGVAVDRITLHGPWDSGRYTAAIGDTTITIGGVDSLLRWETWQRAAFAHGEVKARPKAKRWEVALRAMQRMVEELPAEEAEEAEIFAGWVEDHVQQSAQTVRDETTADFAENVLALKAPYRSNGCVHVNVESLRRMLINRKERIGQAELVKRFRAAGWAPAPKQARTRQGRKVFVRYWRQALDSETTDE